MNPFNRHSTQSVLAFAGFVLACLVSFGADSQTAAPVAQSTEARLQAQGAGWRIQCAHDTPAQLAYHCAFLQEIFTQREKAKVAAVEIDINAALKRVIITVPAGVDLEAGMDLLLDDKPIKRLAYSTCYSSNCIAIWSVSDQEWRAFLASGQMAIVFQDMQAKPFRIDLATRDFSETYGKLVDAGLFSEKTVSKTDQSGFKTSAVSGLERDLDADIRFPEFWLTLFLLIVAYVTLKLFLPIGTREIEARITRWVLNCDLKQKLSALGVLVFETGLTLKNKAVVQFHAMKGPAPAKPEAPFVVPETAVIPVKAQEIEPPVAIAPQVVAPVPPEPAAVPVEVKPEPVILAGIPTSAPVAVPEPVTPPEPVAEPVPEIQSSPAPEPMPEPEPAPELAITAQLPLEGAAEPANAEPRQDKPVKEKSGPGRRKSAQVNLKSIVKSLNHADKEETR